jgi:hypothetical protein
VYPDQNKKGHLETCCPRCPHPTWAPGPHACHALDGQVAEYQPTYALERACEKSKDGVAEEMWNWIWIYSSHRKYEML